MRYVKKILHSTDGYIPVTMLRLWASSHPVSFIVHDTERNSDSISTVYSLVDGRDLGYSYNDSCYLGVALEGRYLQLHKYIESVECIKGVPPAITRYDDYICLNDGTWSTSTVNDTADKTLVVNTDIIKIDILGAKGSVCTRRDSAHAEFRVMSLYSLLGGLCRELKLNVMSYKQIQFRDVSGKKYTVVTFQHGTDEAERFFMKMYLDVLRP